MSGAGGKSKKIDRNRKSGQNKAYQNDDRHNLSHMRRMVKHIRRYRDLKTLDRLQQRFTAMQFQRGRVNVDELRKQVMQARA